MKYFYLLFFICAAQAYSVRYSRTYSVPPNVTLASVRDLNSGLPKCVGTFITPDTLLTTARCLFCERECNVGVFIYDPAEGKLIKHKIKFLKMHSNPQKHDIGFIKLEKRLPESVVVELHDEEAQASDYPAFSFFGKYRDGQYVIAPQDAKVLNNAKCTFALHKFISQTLVCGFSDDKYFFKEQDQGTPLIYTFRKKMYLLGMYMTGDFDSDPGAKIGIYHSIVPYIEWININLKNKTDILVCPEKEEKKQDGQDGIHSKNKKQDGQDGNHSKNKKQDGQDGIHSKNKKHNGQDGTHSKNKKQDGQDGTHSKNKKQDDMVTPYDQETDDTDRREDDEDDNDDEDDDDGGKEYGFDDGNDKVDKSDCR